MLTRGSGRGEFIRQTGSPGRYGVVVLILEPADLDGRCSLSWEVAEETIPVIFLDATVRAIHHVIGEDGFEGDYLSDCRIRVVEGAYNHVDSSMNCYVMASALAMREALRSVGLYSSAASVLP
ncbi:hypothetical protein [Massilia sp. CCM 8734]|uniref:hypothetical protein n=1 Tax=Massilia sp. CCM 8734 TaxID=2609283 RepID=UPI00141F8935|nr:hypothetical protein [Massilia sp. CCM 8734]